MFVCLSLFPRNVRLARRLGGTGDFTHLNHGAYRTMVHLQDKTIGRANISVMLDSDTLHYPTCLW